MSMNYSKSAMNIDLGIVIQFYNKYVNLEIWIP